MRRCRDPAALPYEGLLDRLTRRTVVRLAVLAGLLLLFPAAAILLHETGSPPPRPTAFALTGALESAAGPSGSIEYLVRLELRSRAGVPWRVDQVFLTLLDGERPVSTLIEDPPALAAHHPGAVDVPAGARTPLGTFAIVVPEGAGGDVLLATVRLTEPASGGSATVQVELPVDPAKPQAETGR